MLAAVSNKVIMRFDMDELDLLNDDDVLKASRNFNDSSLESERIGRDNASTSNVHDEGGDKYVNEKRRRRRKMMMIIFLQMRKDLNLLTNNKMKGLQV
jgi:hypothetical protein